MTISKLFSPDTVATDINDINAKPSNFFKSDTEILTFSLSVLDLTTLEGNDTVDTIKNLCNKAKSFKETGLPNVAAVCVYPVFVRQAKQILLNTGIHVASVAGAFPSGQSPIHIKLSEIKYAIDEGADEIDMVISRGKFIQGDFNEVFDEIQAIKHICGNVHLKVILETGEIGDLNSVYDASVLAIEAGADFIKTSTGKIAPAATPEVSYVMLKAINKHFIKTGKKIGFKPAGGIATTQQASTYIRLVESIAGEQWLTSDLFRIGASRLATNITDLLTK
jgi:deoxyribose-phosphate aldolase